MDRKGSFSWEKFEAMPIVGIARGLSKEILLEIIPVYLNAGLTTLEVTMNSEEAEDSIRALVRQYGGQMNIGAGTVRNRDDLELALNVGAQFIVTPNLDEYVVKECVRMGVPIFPGAYTPTEIFKAWSLGASIVKVFPASGLGASYFKDLKGPMPDIRLMPTGGVTLDTLLEYKQAGVSGYGIGSPLFPSILIENREWESLGNHFQRFVSSVKS